jgi:hypothetical protein
MKTAYNPTNPRSIAMYDFPAINPNLSEKLRKQIYREHRTKALTHLHGQTERSHAAHSQLITLIEEIIAENHQSPQAAITEALRNWRMGQRNHGVLYLTSVLQISECNAKIYLAHLAQQ